MDSLIAHRVRSLVYWSDPTQTALCLALALAALLASNAGYSALTLAAYIALFSLVARFLYRNGVMLLVDLKVIEPRPLLTAPKAFFNVEDLQPHLPAIVDRANSVLHTVISLLLCEDNALAIKWMAGLYALALFGKMLGTETLLFAIVVGALTVPKGYEMKRAEVDYALEVGKVKLVELVDVAGSKAKEMSSKAATAGRAAVTKAKARKAAPKVD